MIKRGAYVVLAFVCSGSVVALAYTWVFNNGVPNVWVFDDGYPRWGWNTAHDVTCKLRTAVGNAYYDLQAVWLAGPYPLIEDAYAPGGCWECVGQYLGWYVPIGGVSGEQEFTCPASVFTYQKNPSRPWLEGDVTISARARWRDYPTGPQRTTAAATYEKFVGAPPPGPG